MLSPTYTPLFLFSRHENFSDSTWKKISFFNTGFPGGSVVKSQPAMQEMWVLPHWEDPLEKEMATHSNILAWEIPRTEEPGGLQFTGSQGSDTTK